MGTAYYWNKTGANANWATFTGNWWYDSAHTSQATEVPVANANVYLDGTTAPATGPAAITFDRFDTSNLNVNLTDTAVTSPITIAASGVLVVGSATYSTRTHTWAGIATAAGITITFRGVGGLAAAGQIGDNANISCTGGFYGTIGHSPSVTNAFIYAGAVVGNNATLVTGVNARAGTWGTGTIFNGNSFMYGGTLGDGYQFNDTSYFDPAVDNVFLGSTTGGIWNATGLCAFANRDNAKYTKLLGPMILQKPLKLMAHSASTGNIVISPHEAWDITLGTGGSKIIVPKFRRARWM